MCTALNMQFDFGQLGARLLVLWGSAAWVQSQSPGASALAAPHPFPRLAGRRRYVSGRGRSR
jgi:hypothetical protein